jgi:hypothetical protein
LPTLYFILTLCVITNQGALKRFCLVSTFPGEFDIVAAEVAVGGCLLIDRFTQAELTDDRAGARIEIVWLDALQACCFARTYSAHSFCFRLPLFSSTFSHLFECNKLAI